MSSSTVSSNHIVNYFIVAAAPSSILICELPSMKALPLLPAHTEKASHLYVMGCSSHDPKTEKKS